MIIKVNSNFQEKKENSQEAQICIESLLIGSFFAKLDERKKRKEEMALKMFGVLSKHPSFCSLLIDPYRPNP